MSGGAEHVAWETGKRLVADFEVHILTIGTARTCLKDNLRIHYAPPTRPYTLFYSTILKPRMHATFGEISPDILHSHTPLPWAYVFAKAKCAKVVTCHGLGFSESSKYPRQRYPARFLLKRALENADIVTAPSKWLADYIEEKYDVSCTTLPNGIDTHIFAPMKGLSTRSNVIVYVGRFVARKGIRELLEAARTLREYEFWLIGARTGTVEVPSLPNVRVMGFVDNPVICYNQASLCVFPSYWENFPLVGLEAMACGRAIVATRLGFSEYVENGRDGVLVEPGRSDELIRSIRYLMENRSARARLERNAREKALQYDWGIIMNRYRALYERLQ
jgi:glycosyltransferase involved in cell wall biosynthesis